MKSFKRIAFINKINWWWPPNKLAESIGISAYCKPTSNKSESEINENNEIINNWYNILIFSFHLNQGTCDAALVYTDPLKYFGTES